jgi:DEAD/DEAH box helicase domain-containing protein
MLPAHLANNIRRQILFYLQSTFDFQDKTVAQAFEQFLLARENGVFKGPWVTLRRPYRPAGDDEIVDFGFTVPFHPFRHQARSWRRLDTRDNRRAQPTIVTTGTGSGKTECFSFPILDHCRRMRAAGAMGAGQKGIKAIVLYPMNALAADQEKRLAAMIHQTSSLKNAGVTVGNYTGRYDPSDPGAGKDSGMRTMGRHHGISHHETLQESPPDILLTNYKMLDYLLLRPQDARLWRFNSPTTDGGFHQPLKFLVLDELHTYDGAQGADVACLIRRLKQRLGIAQRELCMVGTSATLDSQDASSRGEAAVSAVGSDADVMAAMSDVHQTPEDRLARFAATLFEEDKSEFEVIGESRVDIAELIRTKPQPTGPNLPADSDDDGSSLPRPADCDSIPGEDSLLYGLRQAKLWGGPVYGGPDDNRPMPSPELSSKADSQLTAEDIEILRHIESWAVEVGDWLRYQPWFEFLLKLFDAADADGTPITWATMVDELTVFDLGFKNSIYDDFDDRSMVCASFFALVAAAKTRERRSGRAFPLVPTQVQLWIRELARLGRLVHPTPTFTWLDEPGDTYPALPAFHCSGCGESGWIALRDLSSESTIGAVGVTGHKLVSDPTQIYAGYFGFGGRRSPHLVILSPERSVQPEPVKTTEPAAPVQQEFDQTSYYLCPRELVLRLGDGNCPISKDTFRFPVRVNEATQTSGPQNIVSGNQGCPRCGEVDTVFFIGSRSATLSSVAIDEMFGSTLNNDPKLLAFTDSVQDASHRAGFFTARTYSFTFRTALQHLVDHSGVVEEATIPMRDIGARLLAHWSTPRAGWKGGIRESMAVLMPPDLQSYWSYLNYRNDESIADCPDGLRREIEARLGWEVTSGFGVNQPHGRTLEPAGSCCLGWDELLIDATIDRLKNRLPRIDTTLLDVPDDRFRLWIYGFLHHARLRGALFHPYLTSLATQNAWGKDVFLGRRRVSPGERETYPHFTRFRPRLMTTMPDRNHLHVLNAAKVGARIPWQIMWANRALRQPTIHDASMVDLIDALLTEATTAGLLMEVHRDGDKRFYAISDAAARLGSEREILVCDQTKRAIVRPPTEAAYWLGAPSMEEQAGKGMYVAGTYTDRQLYYQRRYRKGALRRVVASEHTGLLATEARESVETNFAKAKHADDPNILTCTSTLEMGIDIGDLSSTMLCSIPPTTASYLQRIGRAGRSTGTALVVSVVNQRPHDLFFYGRPGEMLRGKVDPPGCWLDASAVLVRQYLAFVFDSAVAQDILKVLPKTGRQLAEDLDRENGHLRALLTWMTQNEADLQHRFLTRYSYDDVRYDTRIRFASESKSDTLTGRIYQASGEFSRMVRDLENARRRLQDQREQSDTDDQQQMAEIDQELRILSGRLRGLSQSTALEILTDHGLLPNYAFPERGVRFYGSVYNKHHRDEEKIRPIELTRPAGSALRELAPASHFYTNSRRFEIQQLAIGNANQPILDRWAICGACGHMRLVSVIEQAGASPACPQCHHSSGDSAQVDRGQHHEFLEFSRSQALSSMENYESLSGDSRDDRNRQHYQILRSFDITGDQPTGAVTEDSLPLGIEYRSSVTMREVNVGYSGEKGTIKFGVDQEAPEHGFRLCGDCGVVVPPGESTSSLSHRRSCKGRRENDRRRQQQRSEVPYNWQATYLYRSLQSEAVRMLLPLADDEDIATLTACVHLGLRLRFDGSPAHLIVAPHVMPNTATGTNRYYLFLMDAVPGGTGYLKSLYQEQDGDGRPAEGLMQVFRLAKRALETCSCRQLGINTQFGDDPTRGGSNGCYRCIRAYHLQYSADKVSSQRGIELLDRLIKAGEKRVKREALADFKPTQLFGSMLERRFVDRLQAWVESSGGAWKRTIIAGTEGFQFSWSGRHRDQNRVWELQLQPTLGSAQGVMKQSQPDFMLRCDDESILPIAIFTDGFEFHCTPPNNRLADDFAKRRAILESGRYHVWSITWDDLKSEAEGHTMACNLELKGVTKKYADLLRKRSQVIPEVTDAVAGGMQQLQAFIHRPNREGWRQLTTFMSFYTVNHHVQDACSSVALAPAINAWRQGQAWVSPQVLPDLVGNGSGEAGEENPVSSFTAMVATATGAMNQDVISYAKQEDLLANRMTDVVTIARLADDDSLVTGSDYRERWRRFLAVMNLYQFNANFTFMTVSEVQAGTAPEPTQASAASFSVAWQSVIEDVISTVRPWAVALAEEASDSVNDEISVPEVEVYLNEDGEDCFAEMAWPDHQPPIAILAGDQSDLTDRWRAEGWHVVTTTELQSNGIAELLTRLRNTPWPS